MPVSEQSILLYSTKVTPRLLYTCTLLFKELLHLDIEITTDKETFLKEQGAKINYSRQQFSDEVFINASPLLFEQTISSQKIELTEWNNCKIFFLSPQKAALPYDPLAAAFYLVSRYEEYLPYHPDKYGRFKAEDTLAFKNDFLKTPVVNNYALHLKIVLQKHFTHLRFSKNKFQFFLTYDIDQAYAYKEKGLVRNAGSLLRSLIKGDTKTIGQRLAVLQHKTADPFDTFDQQLELHKKLSIQPRYFFLLGNYNKFDNNINWHNAPLQKLIKQLSSHYSVGIHLSKKTNAKPQQIPKEINRLETITGKKITANRQHFLMLKFPDTYEHLIANGITEDYSMGFSSQIGFRAGIASPFYFYNLKKEEQTPLKIYPFAVMDATLFYYLNYSADIALEQTLSLINEVKKNNGLFVFLAHNDLLNNTVSREGWFTNFNKILHYGKSLEQ